MAADDEKSGLRDRVAMDPALGPIVGGLEAVEAASGDEFFLALVQHLTRSLDVDYAFVSELTRNGTHFRTRAVWGKGARRDDFEVPLDGTPCEAVLGGTITHHADRLQETFPADKGLADWGVRSYCGVPLVDAGGAVIGHLAILDGRPMPDAALAIPVLRIFSARARAEIERLKAEASLRESESLFRDLYEEAPIAYCSVDADARFIRVNRRMLELFGCEREDQMLGCSAFDFVTDGPSGKAKLEISYRKFLAGEPVHGDELEGRRLDGSRIWVRHAVTAIRYPDGQGPVSRSTLEDITDRKLAEEALRVSEERLARILGSAMDAIVTFDDDRRIELFNDAAEKVFRCARADAIGTDLSRFLGANARAHALPATELVARRADGSEFTAEATVSHVDVEARTLHTLILRDVDERRRAERELRELSLHKEYLEEEIKSVHNFEEIIGRSRALSDVLDKVRLVASTPSTVLILGETGTGKELIARAVHSASARGARPFIKVNCAALPTGLIESELFGHERGAFTGATERRVGRFELAQGGTIFLDEIGEMPVDVQSKLLRVLQEHEFERIGGRETIRADVRVIAATNRDLATAAAKGTFRSDLYYRLNVFPLTLPPLRDRVDDIPLLVHYFMGRYAAQIGRKLSRVPVDVMGRLTAYAWPGNVRELEHVIERAVILSPGPDLDVRPEALAMPERHASPQPVAVPRPSPTAAAGDEAPVSLEEAERDHITAVLRKTAWRIEGPTGAARLLDMNPSTLRSRMKKLGIRRSTETL